MKKLHHERLSSNLMAAKEAGVRIGLGSDSFCADLTPFGVQSLNELKALVGVGLSEMDAIVAATRSGAEILRIENRTGTLERGKSADLLVLRENPLDDIDSVNQENLLLIMKEGKLVKDALS
jgi:imidazolonepropionase-like amidohydrolase